MEIRRYKPTDFEQVWDLHVLAMRKVGAYLGDRISDPNLQQASSPLTDNDINGDLYQIEKVYFDNNGEFLVGEEQGRIIAMGAFRKITQDMAELKRMRVQPDLQGRGLGQLMLTELEDRARKAGYQKLHLDTGVVQLAAQKLYLKNGYHEVGHIVLAGLDCILFEKQL